MGFKLLQSLSQVLKESMDGSTQEVEFSFYDMKPWSNYGKSRIYFNRLKPITGKFGSDTENIVLVSQDKKRYNFDIDDFSYNRIKNNGFVDGNIFKQTYPQEMELMYDILEKPKTSTGSLTVPYLKTKKSNVATTILNTLKELYPNNWGRINEGDCQTLDGIIDIFPAIEGERWSILNFFDTNPGVIKILLDEYKKDGRQESVEDFNIWISENGERLFGENSPILQNLIKRNLQSFERGWKLEDDVVDLMKQKFGINDEDIVRYCLGSVKDRVQSIDMSINGKSFQIKPASKTYKGDKGIEVKTYGMREWYKNKKELDYIVYSNGKGFIVFPNSNYTVTDNGNRVIHYTNPVSNPF